MLKFQTTFMNCFANIVIFLTKSLKYPIFNEFLLVSCQPCISSEKRNFLFPCHHFSACHTDWEKFYTVWCQSVLGLWKKHCMQKVLHILFDILKVKTRKKYWKHRKYFLAPGQTCGFQWGKVILIVHNCGLCVLLGWHLFHKKCNTTLPLLAASWILSTFFRKKLLNGKPRAPSPPKKSIFNIIIR